MFSSKRFPTFITYDADANAKSMHVYGLPVLEYPGLIKVSEWHVYKHKHFEGISIVVFQNVKLFLYLIDESDCVFFFKKCENVYYLFDRFGQMAQ